MGLASPRAMLDKEFVGSLAGRNRAPSLPCTGARPMSLLLVCAQECTLALELPAQAVGEAAIVRDESSGAERSHRCACRHPCGELRRISHSSLRPMWFTWRRAALQPQSQL